MLASHRNIAFGPPAPGCGEPWAATLSAPAQGPRQSLRTRLTYAFLNKAISASLPRAFESIAKARALSLGSIRWKLQRTVDVGREFT